MDMQQAQHLQMTQICDPICDLVHKSLWTWAQDKGSPWELHPPERWFCSCGQVMAANGNQYWPGGALAAMSRPEQHQSSPSRRCVHQTGLWSDPSSAIPQFHDLELQYFHFQPVE